MRLEQLAEKCTASGRKRNIIGTVYFREGTAVNEVARYIMKRQQTTSGIWLIQKRVKDPSKYNNVEDGCYVNVRDSKHKLQDDEPYSAMFYNGPDMFIMQ